MAALPSTSSSADPQVNRRWPRWGWRLLIVLLAWFGAGWLWGSYWTAAPGQGAIADDGDFDIPVNIHLQERWALNLDFHPGRLGDAEFANRTAPWKDGTADTGPIKLQWRLLANDGQQVASGTALFHRLDSWSTATVSCKQPLPPLSPGRYRLAGQLSAPPPAAAGMDMAVAIRALNGKAWSVWQLDLAWWMGLLNRVLVLPLSIVLLLVLVGHALWQRRQRGRPH